MKRIIGFEKGVNLGGWLSQCKYTDEHLETFITEKDFAVVKSWGADHVRVPVDYNIFQTEDGEFIEKGFGYVDKAIEWCGKNGLNMVLDLHKAIGYFFDKAENVTGFFESPVLQDYFCKLWEEFAKRYGKYSDRVAFELLNEVTEPSYSKVWNEVSRRAVEVIRSYTKDTKIIIGGYWNNSIDSLKDLEMPYDENVVYTYHCYDPFIFTHQAAYWLENMPSDFKIDYPGNTAHYHKSICELGFDYIQTYDWIKTESFTSDYFIKRFENAVKLCEERNVALYCGEYGVINMADPDSTLAWYKDINSAFEKFNIARACWSYRGVDYGLDDEHMSGVIDELTKYL
ncbi:MAG: glycoside hydrolase family 5 protein [Ruminococcus sp.]|nr:glycoside hydrolase family 5 protein [Ruminococcus sp.]